MEKWETLGTIIPTTALNLRKFVQKKQTPISRKGGQFSSGKKRHIARCACVLERWTDSRCLKLDCVREREKKVTLSVNEKQKRCGFSLSFCGTSSVLLPVLFFFISKQTVVYSPGTFFLSVFVFTCLPICFSPSFSLLDAHFLHTHPHWLGRRTSMALQVWAVMPLENLWRISPPQLILVPIWNHSLNKLLLKHSAAVPVQVWREMTKKSEIKCQKVPQS